MKIQVDVGKMGLVKSLCGKRTHSRAMTEAQKRYVMTEKELIAVVYGCEYYNRYIYGRKA